MSTEELAEYARSSRTPPIYIAYCCKLLHNRQKGAPDGQSKRPGGTSNNESVYAETPRKFLGLAVRLIELEVLYSALSVSIGSTDAALRAGTHAASSAISSITCGTAAKVTGSNGPTPYKNRPSNRAAATAAASPA